MKKNQKKQISSPNTTTNFHSSGLKSKIDQLIVILYSGGVNNPMTAIEQISYLLFLRLLSENEELKSKLSKTYKSIFSGNWSKYSWRHFVTLSGDQLFHQVKTAIDAIYKLPGMPKIGVTLFKDASLKTLDRPTLRAVIQGIHELSLEEDNESDPKGDIYEHLLSKLSVSGTNGQFRTPRHIINMIVAMVDPLPGQKICDPACGTGGFLISAFKHIVSSNTSKDGAQGNLLKATEWKFLEEQAFTGFDNDAEMVKIAVLNLYLHKLEKAPINFHNPLTTNKFGKYAAVQYDVILANPPFAGSLQKGSILQDLSSGANTRSTELLFLKWIIDHLAPKGKAGVIVPNGVLFGSANAAKKIRQTLLENCNLQAVIGLPSGVFKPYSGVATSILIFEKGKPTEKVWFYEISADGFSLDDKRAFTQENDIPDLLQRWTKREISEKVFLFQLKLLKKKTGISL